VPARQPSAARVRLRGGGAGSDAAPRMPRVPAEAVGLLSSAGLQLRAVNWHDAQDGPGPAADAAAPRMSDGDDGAADDGAAREDDDDDDDSFASLASSDEDGDGAEEYGRAIAPAQVQLWAACKSGDDAGIYRLVRAEDADVDARDPSFGLWTACHYAAHAGRSRVLEALWRLGANIDARNGAGFTPLAIAAAEGHVSLVQKLVAKGADVTATSEYGSTALHQAALNGCTRTCEALLTLGADVNGSNLVGVTPLHMAVTGQHADTAEKLLEWGAGLEQSNLDGWTALHYAAQAGAKPLVELMLQRKADPLARSKLDETPMEKAVRHELEGSVDGGGGGGGLHRQCYMLMAKAVLTFQYPGTCVRVWGWEVLWLVSVE
jgi:ankyrin repeat protein